MRNLETRNMSDIIEYSYKDYASDIAENRVLPDIDGLKPVQRNIIYDMYEIKATSDKPFKKSARIVGDTMGKYHPHGDSSIYEALTMMEERNGALNSPYIEGKSNFGSYADGEEASAMRYTECRLSKLGESLLDGINENAVDIIPNFDETEKMPSLLPVKFPSIIVNSTDGIGVGFRSVIPSYNIDEACIATEEMIKGNIKSAEDLVDILGYPSYSTGSMVHEDRKELLSILKKGRGRLVYSATAEIRGDQILFTDVPYGTNVKKIIEEIRNVIKEKKELREISKLDNLTGRNTRGILVTVKRGYDPKAVLRKLYKLTSLRNPISYEIIYLYNGMCKENGVYGLLLDWIEFAENRVKRIYTFRLNKTKVEENLLTAYELVGDRVKELGEIIINNTSKDAIKIMIDRFNMSENQAQYILERPTKYLTKDYFDSKIKDLENIRLKIKDLNDIINSKERQNAIIIEELEETRRKFGKKKKTEVTDKLVETNDEEKKYVPAHTKAIITMTKNFMLNKFVTETSYNNFDFKESGEEVIETFVSFNDSYLLVFMRDGSVHRILIDDITQSRKRFVNGIKDYIPESIDERDIVYVDVTGGKNSFVYIIREDGSGVHLKYERFLGKRRKYISNYPEVENGERVFVSNVPNFFAITANKKAALLTDVTHEMRGTKSNLSVARIDKGDRIIGLLDLEAVPDKSSIDLDRYQKGYTVKIREDKLW